MTTVLALLAALGPLLAVPYALRSPRTSMAARTTVAACGVAALASAVLLVITGIADDGRPSGLIDLPDAITVGADRVAAMLLLAITATGAVVASFSGRSLDESPRSPRYFAAVAVVVSGAALVATPTGPILLVVGWMISGWALVDLTRGWSDTLTARRAHERIRSTVIAGDVSLIAAVVVAWVVAGAEGVASPAVGLTELRAESLLGIDAHVVVGVLLVIAGAARSSLVPFHRWLVGTLFAPTPVSALVHAGFVSGAGLLLIQFAPIAVEADAAMVLAFVLAVATIVIALVASAHRPDAKGALAWSTVGQMAFMVVQCTIGAFSAAVFHIVGHGMYKAAQFLGVGETAARGLRARRRPGGLRPVSPVAVLVASAAIASGAVVLGLLVGPRDLEAAEGIVLASFAWLAVASAAHGWLASGSRKPIASITFAALGGLVVGVGYFLGLRVVKNFLDPGFAGLGDTAIGVGGALLAVAVVSTVAIVDAVRPDLLRRPVATVTQVRPPLDLVSIDPDESAATTDSPPDRRTMTVEETEIDRGRLTADVARAGALIAPMWPLSSFVAVNPLGGLEPDGFEQAVADGERWLRGRTVPTLHAFRTGHALGRSTEADLERAIRQHASAACERPAIEASGRTIGADEIVLADLLYGPENVSIEIPRTRLEAIAGVRVADQLGIDEMVADWVASYLTGVGWPATARNPRLVTVAHGDLQALASRRLTQPAVAWLDTLEPHSHSAVEILAASLEIMGVEPDDRVDEIRGHLAAVSGWAGIAKWRSDWAHADETLPPLRLVDIAAVRAMTTAAVLVGIGAVGAMSANRSAPVQPVSDDPAAALRAGRIDAVAAHFDLSSDDDRAAIGEILDLVAPSSRPLMWLHAHESNFDERMLTLLDRPSRPTTDERPDAQIVLCIDVRSEGFRRNLEALGRDETLGFAGFFGVPMSVQESGWSKPEARCPVLVSPSVTATERARFDAVDAVADRLMRARTVGALSSAHGATKHLAGAAFAAAETVGWFTGPAAAVRTFAPSKSLPDARQDGTTTIELGDDMLTEQRLFAAESVLRTMGLVERFAPVVVLCGHTSATTNNPHATALECGACAGAGGASNARTVAALLNEPDVRVGLVERGIEIPDDTWFLAGVHETVSDTVTLLDVDAAPAESADAIVALSDRLEQAANANSAVRARHLPGPDETVRTRGNDWAQVRPEWGLATNAAFVIGPRAMTEDLDLAGRAFLHSYRPDRDPEGAVLEAIMTAPLVVGHWISSQYFFSTVDAEAFGAGDKLLHNPIGTIGVLSGAGGDLRVGLPLQSTHVDGRPHHQPVRLLAVIEADLTVIDEIIDRNAILTQLVGGGWIRIAARATADEPWSTRIADGTWSALPRRIDIHPTLEIS